MRPSRDAGIGIGVLLVTAVAAAALLQSPSGPGPSYRLSGRGPAGLSGLGAALRSAGFRVAAGDAPTIPHAGLTIAVEPAGMTHDEAAAWLGAVRAGAVLLYATDTPDPLTAALGLGFGPGGDLSASAAGRRAFPRLTRGPIFAARSFSRLPAGAAAIVGTSTGAAAAVVPLGRGSVWALAEPRLLTNAGAVPAGLAVALPLARRAGGTVVVDEFHHGAGPALGAVGYLPTTVKVLVAQAAVVALLWAASAARRLGPVAAPAPAAARGVVELVRSLARLHRAAGRRDAATAPLARDYARSFGGLVPAADAALADLRGAPSDAAAVEACRRIEDIRRSMTGGNR